MYTSQQPNTVKNQLYEIGEQFIKLRTNVTNPYEENFFQRILPLKKITASQDMAIYWVDNTTNMITSSQKSSDIKEPCSINIDSKGPLPGVVAYFKHEYLISDAERYAQWYCNHIKLPERVKCILSFPVLSQKADGLIVIVELYRMCCFPYTEMEAQYCKELSKWIALSMEQNYDMKIQKNLNDMNVILSEMLLDFFGGYINYITYMTNFMEYLKDTVNADQLFFYFVTATDDEGYAKNCEMYMEEYHKKTQKTNLIKINAKIKFFNENTFEYQIIRSKQVINEEITIPDDSRIDSQIKRYIQKVVKSIVYLPVVLNEIVVGIIVLINKNVRISYDHYTDVEVDLLMRFVSYLSLAIHYIKVKNELEISETKYFIYKETLVHQLIKKVDHVDDIATNPVVSSSFYEFDWAPQDNDNIISLTYFIFTNTCPGLFHEDTLKLFLTAVKNCYRDLPYHNFRLGFIFTHMMFCVLLKIDDIFDIEEKAAYLLISLTRYMDYNGLNNETMSLLGHPMTRLCDKLYHQSHVREFVQLLVERTKLFDHIPKTNYNKIMKLTNEERINVATIKNINKDKILQLLDEDLLDFNNIQHRQYIRILILWCTFQGRHALKLELSRKVNEELYKEWYSQGDLLLSSNKTVPRKQRRNADLKEIELKHIDKVLLPHYELLCRIFPALCELKELLLFTKKAIELEIDLKNKKTWSIEQSLGN